jgi:hypothetical protein
MVHRVGKGREVANATLDSWVKDALKSAQRLQSLLREGNKANHDLTASRPTLTGDDFRMAFAAACERHGLRLQETRNSSNQFVTGVFHFQLPQAFRDPIFRPRQARASALRRSRSSFAQRRISMAILTRGIFLLSTRLPWDRSAAFIG